MYIVMLYDVLMYNNYVIIIKIIIIMSIAFVWWAFYILLGKTSRASKQIGLLKKSNQQIQFQMIRLRKDESFRFQL
jgi:hypothetical protein